MRCTASRAIAARADDLVVGAPRALIARPDRALLLVRGSDRQFDLPPAENGTPADRRLHRAILEGRPPGSPLATVSRPRASWKAATAPARQETVRL